MSCSSYVKPSVTISGGTWNKSNGNFVVSGAYNKDYNLGKIELQTKLEGESTWNSRDILSVSDGKSLDWNNAWIAGYKSGTNGTALTNQQFANGFKVRVRGVDSRLSQYSGKTWSDIYSGELTSPKLATMKGDLSVTQNSRDVVLNWSIYEPSTKDADMGKFGIQKWSTANNRWEEIKEVEYIKGKTDYSYTYTLSDAECNKGQVDYKFRVWKKYFANADIWKQYMTVEATKTIFTDYKKLEITGVSPVQGKTESVVTWKFTSSEGVWDKEAQITITVAGNGSSKTIAPTYDVNSYTVNSLQSCVKYTYSLSTKVMNASYQTSSNMVTVLQPDVKARVIENFEASKGFYSDYTLIRWDVPSDKSDFKRFEVSRQPINGGPKVAVAQLTHDGLTSYSIQDRDADAGVLYTYIIEGYSECDGQPSLGDSKFDIGFSQPYATLSGRVAYSGNQAVAGVTIAVTGGEKESRNASIHLDGAANSTVTAPAAVVNLKDNNAFTFQTFISPASAGDILYKKDVIGVYRNADGSLSLSLGGSAAVKTDTMLASNSWRQLTVSVSLNDTKTSADCKVYVNGKLRASNTIKTTAAKFTSGNDNKVFLGCNDTKGTLAGNMDEIRFWNVALTEQQMLDNFDSYLSGREENLVAYYRCDEVGVNDLFDISGHNGVFNKNHAKLSALVAHKTDYVPSAKQLANKTKTDEDGNYLINTIPYTSEGIQYNVVPEFEKHAFSPNKRPIYASSSSVVFNGIDFEDKSSFDVTGFVYYYGTEYPVEGVNFYIDGVICSLDGKACTTDEKGAYKIAVPIGAHSITVQKQGHNFVSEGRYPANKYEKHVFDQPVSNLTFWDSTLVVLAGRVCGGDVQAAHPLGLGLSTNNIGQAKVVLSVDAYRMNTTTDGKFEDGAKRDVSNATSAVNCSGYYGYGDNHETHNIYVLTDPKTGEWAVKVPPITYDYSASVISNDDIKFPSVKIDASNAQVEYTDSVTIDGELREFKYCASRIDKYNSPAVFTVNQKDAKYGQFGESEYVYLNLIKNDTVPLYTVENGKASYNYGFPVFFQESTYQFELKAFERYENADDEKNVVVDEVNLSGAIVSITNEMSAEQSVYVEDGTTEEGVDVKQGDFVELTESQIELDENGYALYQWKAGFPSISGDNSLGINMACTVEGRTQTWSNRAIVFGNLPSGNNFVTSGPDKVCMILRDPAGTGSSAYWQEGSTFTFEEQDGGSVIYQNESSTATSFGLYGTQIVGTPGYGVITEVGQKNTIDAGFSVNSEITTSKTWTTTVTNTKTVSTSGDFDYVGAHGDVFIGTATNIIFGNSRSVALVKEDGEFVIKTFDNITTGSTFGTGFNYTQAYIENTLLPNLEVNRNALLKTYTQEEIDAIVAKGNDTKDVLYLTTLSPDDERFGSRNYDKDVWGDKANTDKSLNSGPSYTMVFPKVIDPKEAYQDMVLWYNEQISLWINELAANEEAKVTAINNRDKYFDQNFSFDAGANVSASTSTCTGQQLSIEREVETLVFLGLETGVEINKQGFDINTKTTVGGKYSGSTTQGSEHCVEVGFELAEEGDDDALSVDVFHAPDGFGPIFVTRGGQTSCPYEGEIVTKYYKPGTVISYATMKIEDPKITCENPYAVDVPAGGQATYTLLLQNESETGEDVWFQLGQEMDTNPYGAILQINGMALTSANLDFLVRAGEVLPVTLTLKQGRPDVMKYENIGISLFSSCQWDETGLYEPISSTVFVSAEFVPSCSELNLVADGTTANTYVGPQFSGVIRDYDPSYSGLKALRVLYRQDGDANWTLGKEYVLDEELLTNNNEMLPEGGRINYKLDMSSSAVFPDGNYEIKVLSACKFGTGEVTRESDVVKFVKDMARPQLLGLAQPGDGILEAGDEISVEFNEDIRNGSLTRTNNFIISGVLNDYVVDHNVALKLDGAACAARTQSDIFLADKDFTVDFWFNAASAGTLFQHADEKNGLTIGINAEKKLVVSFAGQQLVSEDAVPMNDWTFLTFAYSAQSGAIYAKVAADGGNYFLFNGDVVPAYKGNGPVSVGMGISGAISELAIWDTDRNASVAISEMYQGKAPSTRNLIGYWRFDEGHGNVAKDVARNRNMVLANTDWYLNNINYALALDGTGYADFNIASTAVENSADYLVELWFRGAAQSNAYLWSAGKIGMKFNADGLLVLESNGAETVVSAEKYLDNAWHSLALNVLRNGMATVYVDGEAVKQIASERVLEPQSAYLTVGALRSIESNKPKYEHNFVGDVDDVRLWVASFNSTAIEANRFSRLNGDEEGLVAYYPFESSALDQFLQMVTSFDAADKSKSAAGEATLVGGKQAATAPALKVKPEETSISYNFVASERKIVINLAEAANRLEGTTVTFTVRNVRDVNENISEPIVWSAYVNRNRLVWSDDEVAIEQQNLTASTFTVSISNGGSASENWQLTGLPSWLKASKTNGSLAPLSSQKINFTVDASTAIGNYEETVYLYGNDKINVPLTVSVKVTGKKPEWTVNPKAFINSMNAIGQLVIDGKISFDSDDLVAAFIDGKCVGVTSPKYYERYDAYIVSLDIYGDAQDNEVKVSFKAWDASTGIVYPAVLTNKDVIFSANAIVGSIADPVVFSAQDCQEQTIELEKGWNWVSLYVDPLDASVTSVFSGVRSVASQVKDKLTFAMPSGNRWVGTLGNVSVGKMYRVHAQSDVELNVAGKTIVPAETPVTISNKWNWIGYNQSASASVGEALSGLTPAEGDVIKGQTGFAVFQGYEWVGSLEALVPGAGYMYFSNAAEDKTFTYPTVLSTSASANRAAALTHYRATGTAAFGGNMTVIAHVSCDGRDASFAEVGAFVGGVCRATAVADAEGRVFLTIPGDQAAELTLSVIAADGSETEGIPAFAFAEDAMVGSLAAPFEIALAAADASVAEDQVVAVSVFPNPAVENVHVAAPAGATVKVFNIMGQLMSLTSGDSDIDVTNWAVGYYVVEVVADGKSQKSNFIKR